MTDNSDMVGMNYRTKYCKAAQPPTDDEIAERLDEIRERHAAHDLLFRVKGPFSPGGMAHADRGALLRAVRAKQGEPND